MAPSFPPTVIKRHSNRRLYNNTRTGRYASRKNLEAMARNGEDFVVFDATTGDCSPGLGPDNRGARNGTKRTFAAD
jgi:polyhydroxyalkanoate synthesis regulator protein